MKRTLPLCFALALPFTLAASTAAAEQPAPTAEPPPTTWKMSAHLRPRVEARYNNLFDLAPSSARYVRTDNQDVLSMRSRLGLALDSAQIDALVQLQHAANWGATGGDELTDPGLGIHQVFVTWSPSDWWWLQAGRFEVAYGDERVIGAVGWHQVGRAWDGVRTGFGFADDIGLDLLALFYQDGFLTAASGYEGKVLEDDSFLTGAYFHSKKLSKFVTDVDVYALADLQIDQLGDSPQRQTLGTFGSRVRVEVEPAALVVEGAYQAGARCVPVAPVDDRLPPTLDCEADTVAVSAGFVDSELTVKLGPVTPFVGFGVATGNNPDTEKNEAYFHMYPTAHKFLGLMDLIGPRSNVREARVGATLKAEDFTLRESIHHFATMQPNDTTVGIEADTTIGYKIVDMLSVEAGHAVFVPFDGVATDGSDPTGVATWWFVQLIFNAGVAL